MRRLPLLALALCLSACGSNSSPAAPSTPTGTVGATIDAECASNRYGVTSVTVSVDGAAIGTAPPGGSATKVLPVGAHVITGRSQNGISWGGDTWVTTAANPDRISFFVCVGR